MRDLMFQSLTRDSNHSNGGASCSGTGGGMFQSLTRDSNHSNRAGVIIPGAPLLCFNPSRGIAIIQTRRVVAEEFE